MIMTTLNLITREQAAQFLPGLHINTIDRWIRGGADGRPALPARKVGRKVYIDRAEFEDWLKSSPPVAPRRRGRPRKTQSTI
jgi:excisionase family DNA binding protein